MKKKSEPEVKPIQARIRLGRLGFRDIEAGKFSTSFVSDDGMFYDVDNKHVTESATIEDVISKTVQL